MKKMIKNLKYISIAAVLVLGMFIGVNHAQAGWFYSDPYEIPYDVSGGVTCPNSAPVSNAGTDRAITLPTNSITIPVGGATATDPDGGALSYLWSQSGSTPSTATLTNDTTLTPAFSNLIQGTYTFQLTVADECGTQHTDLMTVTVNPVGVNASPTADAGPDQGIAQPTSAVSVSGSGADSDGTIASYAWSQVGSTPAAANIVAPSSPSTSITGLSALGTYTFTLTVTDNLGATGSDQMQVVVSTTPPSGGTGNLTVSPNTCTIPLGGSTCTVTGASWTTSGATSPKLVDGNTNATLSTLANQAAPILVYVAYPSTLFKLMDGASIIDTETATANCGANSWNGSMCVVSAVNGACAPTHFSCSSGNSINNTGSGPWAWSCQGTNGGSTASCNEGVGVPVCNDTVDNDGDTLIDTLDPGCHSDGDASNAASYVPTDTSEKNTRIKEIEI